MPIVTLEYTLFVNQYYRSKVMIRLFCFSIVLAIVIGFISCTANDSKAPRIIATFPPNGNTDVDPSINEISVTFDEEMMDGNWSWAYTNKDQFPEMSGQPYYTEEFTKNILPVKLESNKEYEIWINSVKNKNFKDKAGNPAIPFLLVFKTK